MQDYVGKRITHILHIIVHTAANSTDHNSSQKIKIISPDQFLPKLNSIQNQQWFKNIQV